MAPIAQMKPMSATMPTSPVQLGEPPEVISKSTKQIPAIRLHEADPEAMQTSDNVTTGEAAFRPVTPGRHFGRWLVLDAYQKTSRGEKKYLCRCQCGTERYVLERALKHGGSLSCGCLRKEALKQTISYDITGQTFGDLTAAERSAAYHKNGGTWWVCTCSCGNTCEVPATILVNGRKTHCGCKTPKKNYYYADIAGQRFGRLVALQRTEKRAGKGGVVWHCVCDCGREVDVPYNSLVYTAQQSCGCRKKEHDKMLGTLQARADGTSLDIIKSRKVPSDNTTGYRGVYLIKGKYVAKIVFQRKAYYLGAYDNIQEAYEARLDAEEALFRPTLEYHVRWQEEAARDPEWAKDNPMRIFVTKENDGFHIEFLPKLLK